MHTIYLIHNSINEKIYVGQTSKSLQHRWNVHVYNATWGTSYRFSKAIRKYGKDAFFIEAVAGCTEQRKADDLEKLWIVALRTYDPQFGYNGTFGGESGLLATEETKKKLSQGKLGHKNPMFGKQGNYHANVSTPEIIAMYVTGASALEVGRCLGTSHQTVIDRLKRAGIATRSVKEAAEMREKAGRGRWQRIKRRPQ